LPPKKFQLKVLNEFLYCRSVKRFRALFTHVLLVCSLLSVSPFALPLLCSPPADGNDDCTSATTPADNDDHSDDGPATVDCALQNFRIEFRVPLLALLRLPRDSAAFNPPGIRRVLESTPARSRIWQFIERAAAAPRAPTFSA
jgi:hypothetical protein